jgi:allantoicase
MVDVESAGIFKASADLASRWLGASVIAANDESFGAKENLINPGRADFKPGNYGHSGEIVDGWETRRRRGEAGQDWVIVRLGCPGVIREIDVDTSFFTGNYPERCNLEACGVEGYPSAEDLRSSATEWIEIVPRSALRGDCSNMFEVNDYRRFTHVRLNIDPDGGVARLRVKGEPIPDPRFFDSLSIDLVSQDNGGVVTHSSDGFYSSASVLNRPDRARNMGEGWETRRRRDNGCDYVIFQLGIAGRVRLVEIDTTHFKHNASGHALISGCDACLAPDADAGSWTVLLPSTPLQPDTRQIFAVPAPHMTVTRIKLDAFPDGGISRLRVWGPPDSSSRKAAGLRWLNSIPETQRRILLEANGISRNEAFRLEALRPFTAETLEQALVPQAAELFHAVIGQVTG